MTKKKRTMINYEENQEKIFKGYEAWRRKQPKCSCQHKHKIAIAIYNGEVEVLGVSDPKHIEVTIMNLDKEMRDD